MQHEKYNTKNITQRIKLKNSTQGKYNKKIKHEIYNTKILRAKNTRREYNKKIQHKNIKRNTTLKIQHEKYNTKKYNNFFVLVSFLAPPSGWCSLLLIGLYYS